MALLIGEPTEGYCVIVLLFQAFAGGCQGIMQLKSSKEAQVKVSKAESISR
jgi:hypothetical protein